MAKLRVHQIEDDLRALWEYAPLATRDLAEKGPTLHRALCSYDADNIAGELAILCTILEAYYADLHVRALMVALRLHPERVFGLHGVDRRFEAFAHANGKEHRRSARRWAEHGARKVAEHIALYTTDVVGVATVSLRSDDDSVRVTVQLDDHWSGGLHVFDGGGNRLITASSTSAPWELEAAAALQPVHDGRLVQDVRVVWDESGSVVNIDAQLSPGCRHHVSLSGTRSCAVVIER